MEDTEKDLQPVVEEGEGIVVEETPVEEEVVN